MAQSAVFSRIPGQTRGGIGSGAEGWDAAFVLSKVAATWLRSPVPAGVADGGSGCLIRFMINGEHQREI